MYGLVENPARSLKRGLVRGRNNLGLGLWLELVFVWLGFGL